MFHFVWGFLLGIFVARKFLGVFGIFGGWGFLGFLVVGGFWGFCRLGWFEGIGLDVAPSML